MSTHRGTSLISRLLLHVLQVETAPNAETGKGDTKAMAVGDGRGTSFWNASMSTHRGTSLISRLLLHVLQVETAPLGDRRKEIRRRWL